MLGCVFGDSEMSETNKLARLDAGYAAQAQAEQQPYRHEITPRRRARPPAVAFKQQATGHDERGAACPPFRLDGRQIGRFDPINRLPMATIHERIDRAEFRTLPMPETRHALNRVEAVSQYNRFHARRIGVLHDSSYCRHR